MRGQMRDAVRECMRSRLRRWAAVILSAALMACLTGCAAPEGVREDGTLKIVTTIWPEYEWVQAILGDNPAGAEVTLLIDSGVDPHSFQPAVSDILELYTCDVLVYVGGASDQWVGKALRGEVDPDLVTVSLLETLGDSLCTEETVEGMEPEGHDHEGHHHEGHDHDAEEYDEHVWLSLRKAQTLVTALAEQIAAADSANAATYRANAAAYNERLSALDAAYDAAVQAAPCKTLLFADRFPFRYLTEDSGLNYYAAFPGCSAETEASFSTVTFLAQKLRTLPAALIIDGGDGAIARTVAETAGNHAAILTLDSMQSARREGQTYLSVMEDNLTVLRQALGL